MVCPKCQAEMRSYERNGINVDQCSECRGIFLDRGELEHLINAENSWAAAPAQQPQTRPPQQTYDSYRPDNYSYNPKYDKKRKKRNFLEELFD